MPEARRALSRRNSLVWLLHDERAVAASWSGYLFALLLVGIAFGVRLAMLPVDGGYVFVTFYPAIAISALLLGAGPALLAVALGAAIADYVFMPPYGSFGLRHDQILPLVIFVASGGLTAAFAFALQRSAFDLRESNDALRAINKRVFAADAALRVTEQRLRTIIKNAPAMIGYWNRDLVCEFANDAYYDWFGVAPARVIGMHLKALLGDELFQLNEPYALAALSGRAQRFDRVLVKPDGSRGFTEANYVPDFDESGLVRGFFVLIVDVTVLRQSYDRIRELAQRLETVREDERRSIAVALHEGVAQELFALRLTVDQLKSQYGTAPGVADACEELSGAILKCLGDARQVANDLRPSAIAHQSLAAIIKAHARYVGERSGLEISVAEIAPFPELGEATALLFFRAAQEALSNVTRHAKARKVQIALRASADRLTMQISDDGVGIADGALDRPGALGLLGIRERLDALGGDLSVHKGEETGTVVTIALPIAAGALPARPPLQDASFIARGDRPARSSLR